MTVFTHQRKRRSVLAAVFVLVSLLLCAVNVGAAHAADAAGDAEGGAPAPAYDYRVQGNVRAGGEPVQGATVQVTGVAEGEDFQNEAITDEKGRYVVGVPVNDVPWNVALVLDTVPAGIDVPDDFVADVEVTFGASNSVSRNFTIGASERQTASFWDQLAARTVNGLNFGLMLALAAIGLSLVYGTTGLSNFAHGEMVTFGAIAALLFSGAGLPIVLAIVLAILLAGAAGWGLDRGLWQPLRKKGLSIVQMMIVSIGLSLAARYAYQMIVGGETLQLAGRMGQSVTLGPIRLTVTDLLSMGISIVAIAGVAWWLRSTKMGKATRAVSDNPSLAEASGISVNLVIRFVWVIGSALAGLSGVLWAWFRPGIRWDMGTQILLLTFAAVTLGGLGSAWGALIGAIIVGLMVEVSTLWIPSDLKYVGALVVLIVVLLLRPQGILGRKERVG